MDLQALPAEYTLVEGLEALTNTLVSWLDASRVDPNFAKQPHYILYQVGKQKSWIKVDTSSIPFHFHYQDTLGRPATHAIKETIARFLWEKCGEKERYMSEHQRRK